MEIKQKIYFNTLVIEIKDHNYEANISIEGGTVEPFNTITVNNGKETINLELSRCRYGYIIRYNRLVYFIRYKDFNVTSDIVISKAKEGYEEFKKFVELFLKKGKVIRRL